MKISIEKHPDKISQMLLFIYTQIHNEKTIKDVNE